MVDMGDDGNISNFFSRDFHDFLWFCSTSVPQGSLSGQRRVGSKNADDRRGGAFTSGGGCLQVALKGLFEDENQLLVLVCRKVGGLSIEQPNLGNARPYRPVDVFVPEVDSKGDLFRGKFRGDAEIFPTL